jgi:AcrR family transcriptional regulator
VARPKVPLISRRETLAAALRIVDEEGLDNLSIRRLAFELNVNGASLYHHFKNKEEILIGAATLALDAVRTPGNADQDWRVWLLSNTRKYRQALLSHPELVPILLRRHPLRIGLGEHDSSVELLERQGVPQSAVMPLLETLEALAIGSVVYGAAVERDAHREEWKESFPHLHAAVSNALLSSDEAFVAACMAIMDSIVKAAIVKEATNTTGKSNSNARDGRRRPAPVGPRAAKAH